MINFSTLRLKRKPNQFLVAPEGLCGLAKPHRTSPVYSIPAASLYQAWKKMISEQPRTKLHKADEQTMTFEYVQRSALMRFPDYITVQFLPIPQQDASTLAIYSRSKYGYRDFGVNRKRIKDWLLALNNFVQIPE